MLKVNKKVEYALIGLRHMHSKPREDLTTVREICERYGTPFDPVAHVMRILNTQGLLKSEQGAHGGYRLQGDIRGINLGQLIEMIEGRLAFVDCVREEHCGCGIKEQCNIHRSMREVNNRLIEFLNSVPLADLVQFDHPLLGSFGEYQQPGTTV